MWADDQDPFGHIMNAGFSHFASSCNFRVFESFEAQLGDKINDFINAKGIGVMVKQFTVDIKRPVSYPDSVSRAALVLGANCHALAVHYADIGARNIRSSVPFVWAR